MSHGIHVPDEGPPRRTRGVRVAVAAVIGIGALAAFAGCGSSGSDTTTSRAAAGATATTVYAVATDSSAAIYPWNNGAGQLFTCGLSGAATCTRIAAAGNAVTAVAPVGTRVMVGSSDGTVRDCPGPADSGAGGSCRTPISPVNAVRAMAALPNGYLVLGVNGRLERCAVRSGQSPVCSATVSGVSGPVVVAGDTVYVTGGTHGEEIRTCSVSNLSAGCATVVGRVPAAAGDIANTVTGLAPLAGGVIVTSRDADKNPMVHACTTGSGCTPLNGLGDAQSVFAAASAGDVAYVGGGAGDGYIEGPGYVARCTLSGCTRLPREFDGLGPKREGGIVSALAATTDGFVVGGAMQPALWNCTAADTCTRLGAIDMGQPTSGIRQLVPDA